MQDHVQHFACHCHTECADSMQYSLRMAHRGSRLWLSYDQRVTIQELLGEISGFPQRLGRPTAGLVFLNACGSSKMTPIGVASFPSLFLFNLENEAVVGTETPIPDEFATEFATEFYRQFVQGVSMGEALHRARWTMLKVHKNPLGILYTAYGNPGLRVRKPIL